MQFLRRLLGSGSASVPVYARSTKLVEGGDDLEVVGESFHQETLRRLVNADGQRVRFPIQATLTAELHNEYDENAVSVWIGDQQVGHLSREHAQSLRPGLLALERRHGAAIALSGVIVGGGDGRPSYGVFLSFDAAAFGLAATDRSAPSARTSGDARVRTGLRNAVANDRLNDNYDLGWQSRVPEDTIKAIAYLRAQLLSEVEPVSRHFTFATLADRLYAARDQYPTALDEFDDVCRRHDAEMEAIRPTLIATFGGVPLLTIYKQSAIRHQKAGDWAMALWWAQRGLEIYSNEALNEAVVSDLTERVVRYTAKLAAGPR